MLYVHVLWATSFSTHHNLTWCTFKQQAFFNVPSDPSFAGLMMFEANICVCSFARFQVRYCVCPFLVRVARRKAVCETEPSPVEERVRIEEERIIDLMNNDIFMMRHHLRRTIGAGPVLQRGLISSVFVHATLYVVFLTRPCWVLLGFGFSMYFIVFLDALFSHYIASSQILAEVWEPFKTAEGAIRGLETGKDITGPVL